MDLRKEKQAFIETITSNMTTIETLTKRNNFLENKNKELEKKCKYLKHDIYFLNKNIKELETERDKYKNNCENIIDFASEYNIKCIEELINLIYNYKNNKDFNKNKFLEDENISLKNKLIKYEIQDIVKKGFDTNILYNIVNSKSKKYNYYEDFIHNFKNTNFCKTQKNKNEKKNHIFNTIIDNNKEICFKDICNIPLPDISLDEEILLNENIHFENDIKSKNTKKKLNIGKEEEIKKRNSYRKTDQIEVINNILDKTIKKVKDTEFYKIKLERNKTLIKLYSYIYDNKESINKEDKEELIIEEKIRDLNSYRFNKNCNIYNKIYNNNKIFSSKYIFLPGLFENVKNKYVDLLIYKLELLCNGENIEKIKTVNKLINEDDEKVKHVDNIEIIKKLNIKLL